MKWSEMPLAAFDLETTAANPLTARIVTACVVSIDGAATAAQTWMVDPEVEIPDEAAAVHGITTDRARAEGQDYADGYREIRAAVEGAWMGGRVVAAFNASYDFTVIDREGRRLGYPPLVVGPIVDAFVIDRHVDKYRRGKRTLGVTCEHYRVELGNAHSADADALAAARLAWKLARMYPQEVGELDAEALMANQADWHRARQDDFAAYLRRVGKDDSDVCGDWPIRQVTA